jgi:thiamine kinase
VASQAPSASPRELIPPEALARIPAFSRDARITALIGGTVNRSFSIETAAGRYFLRLHEPVSLALGADHGREAQLQEAAAAAGLAPPLVYADPAHGFAISRFLAGRVWTPGDFADAGQLAKLGGLLRRVHEVMPPVAAPFDLPRLLLGFSGRIAREAPGEAARLENLMDRARLSLAESGSDGRQKTLFHSDPHHSNLIELDDGRLLLVDWEYAAVGDPLFDLACVLAYYPQAVTHAAALVSSAGLEGKVTPGMLRHASWLYALLGYFWYRARRLDTPAGEADLEAERSLLARLG